MYLLLAVKDDRFGSVTQLLTVSLLFLFVLALTYFTTRWIAGFQKGKMATKNIDIIETSKITPNKYLQIVRIGGKYFAIAIGKDNVTLLGELDENTIQFPDESNPNPTMDFKSFLEKAKNLKPKKQGNDDEQNNTENKDY